MTRRDFAAKLVALAREDNHALLFALHKGSDEAARTARACRDFHIRYARQFAR